jgi:hypothetical protein
MAGLIEIAQITVDDGDLSGKAQVFAVIGTVLFLGLVVELVRRRRLVERYALLWMSTALLGVVLAVWNGGLNWLADRLGIISPVNALFLIGLVAVFGLLLNFSVAISRLSEETKILAQTVSRLDAELRAVGRGAGNGRGNGAEPQDDAAEQPAGSAGPD